MDSEKTVSAQEPFLSSVFSGSLMLLYRLKFPHDCKSRHCERTIQQAMHIARLDVQYCWATLNIPIQIYLDHNSLSASGNVSSTSTSLVFTTNLVLRLSNETSTDNNSVWIIERKLPQSCAAYPMAILHIISWVWQCMLEKICYWFEASI